MLRRTAALLALSLAGQTHADIFIADNIPYAPDAKVAERIASECTELGQRFSREMVEQAKEQGIGLQTADAADLSNQPDRLEVRITDVRSYGNAFIGHYKSIDIQLVRYENNRQTATANLSRRSLGGMAGMFKSSCSVLDRVTNALAKDTAGWLKSPAAADTPAETSETPAE